ncbi:MAG: sugar ABC transporter substrate-binding protein [Spirochaetia bacterium]|nr:sugar ABC transporter substrate-binding protein [Spirochaetia bacterium]
MKRLFMVCALVALAGGIIMAAGTQEKGIEPDSPSEIVYYTFSASPNYIEELDSIVSQFNEKEKDITVRVETVGWDDYFTRLEAQIAGGSAPDVFELNYESFVNYASKGVLLPLDAQIAEDEDFDTSIFSSRALEAFAYQGTQYGIPETFSTSVLFYNKDMFDKAGLEYPDASWNWDDTVEAAEQLTNKDAGIWGLYSPIQFWEFYKKAAQNGGELVSEDGSSITIDAEENVEALELMLSFLDRGIMPREEELGGAANEQAFLDGKVAMLVSGIWMFETFKDADFDWDIAVEPGISEKATHFFANGLAVSQSVENPEAAWKWVKFFTSSPEMVSVRMESNWELPAIQNKELVQNYLERTPPENRDAVYDSLDYVIVPPVIEKQNRMQDIIGKAIEEAVLGTKSAAEALTDADRQVERLVD